MNHSPPTVSNSAMLLRRHYGSPFLLYPLFIHTQPILATQLTVSNSVMSLRRHIQLPWSSLETRAIERLQIVGSVIIRLFRSKSALNQFQVILWFLGIYNESAACSRWYYKITNHLHEECEAEWRVLSLPSPHTEVTLRLCWSDV